MTRPVVVYRSEWATVVHGAAEDYLPKLPTESFGLVVTDPPYGVEWESGHRTESFGQLHGDGAADRDTIAAVLRESVRLVGQSRHLYVFGPVDVLDGLKVSAPAELIWEKGAMGGGDTSSPWGPSHERLSFVVSKHRHGGKTGRESVPARLRRGSVLRYNRPTGRKVRHPSEKPVPLLRELIESSSRQGDAVLDPFGGVCSTAVAAILCGRRALVVDTDRRWLDLGVPRIRAAEAHWAAGLTI